MNEVTVDNDKNVDLASSDSNVVVILDSETTVIETFEQGPPGPQGPKGDHGDKGDRGNSVLYGTVVPTIAVGIDGDFYINTTTHFMFGPKATSWPAGTSLIGPQGIAGNTVLYGAADPVAGTGANGDFYINTTSHFIFGPKASGAWPAGTSLVGPQGVRGSKFYTGSGAPGTISGQMDGDNYLNVTNGDVYMLASGAWGAPVGNIRGPQGPVGPGIAEAPTDGGYYARRNSGWVAAVDVGAVRFDSAQGALTTAQKLQGRTNIFAAPADLLAFSGMQINGAFEIGQEKPPGVGTPASGYICDGWQASRSGTSTGYSFASGPIGGGGSLGAYITAAQAVMGASDYYCFYQLMEGYRVARLQWGTPQAQPLTLAFWSAHHRTGVYTGVVKNSASNRCYAFSYTHNVADGAQYNVVTIPGDTGGTWPKDNTTGIVIMWAMACGSNYTAPSLNNWVNGNYVAGPGQVNATAATDDYFRLGGVLALPGSYAPASAYAANTLRPFDEELAICQRYYEKSFAYVTAPASNIGSFNGCFGFNQVTAGVNAQLCGTIDFKRTKRAYPTMSFFNPLAANNQIRNGSQSLDWSGTTATTSETGAIVFGTGAAGSGAGSSNYVHWVADARL